MGISPDGPYALCASALERFVISSSQIYRLDIRILLLEYFWLFIIASSVDIITFSLFCLKVYSARKDSMTTPMLSALFTQ